ncbi:MAG: tetratricopeptide repeat protein [Bacteroidetes bacterium]|nr:tetratricopeptide repeat protein [Bacteroidota bacterium]
MDTTKCLSDALWIDYSKGLLNANTLAKVQAHAAQCEICADIKEGIDAMKMPNQLEERIASLDQKIEDRFSPKKAKVIPLMNWVVAIAAILIAVVGLIYLSQEMNTTPQTIVLKMDTIYLDTPRIVSVPAIAMETPTPAKKLIVKPHIPVPPTENSIDDVKEESAMAAPVVMEAMPEVTKALETEDVAVNSRELKQIESKWDKVTTSKVASVTFNTPNDSLKMLHAYSMFGANAYTSAVQVLSQITANKKSPNYYEALYLAAQCNAKLDNIAEAKAQLKNIPRRIIPYGFKADSLLKTMP